MNYFNVAAIMLVSIGMRASRGENSYSDVWEYLEIKWISMACILVGKVKAKGRLKNFQTTSWFLACK